MAFFFADYSHTVDNELHDSVSYFEVGFFNIKLIAEDKLRHVKGAVFSNLFILFRIIRQQRHASNLQTE